MVAVLEALLDSKEGFRVYAGRDRTGAENDRPVQVGRSLMAWNRNPAAKYGNTRASWKGKTYHSQLERNDAVWLQQLEKDGEISDLREQVRYRIFVNGTHVCDSIVDFAFVCNGTAVWYETKGMETDVYKIKKKLIEATLPPEETYLVNARALMEWMRGRTRKGLN